MALPDLEGMRFTQTFFDLLQGEAAPATEETADQELIGRLFTFGDDGQEELPDEGQLDRGPKPKGNHYRSASGKRIYKRDPKVARRALRMAGYRCQIDESHLSFRRRNSRHAYMEPHHLIPMSMTDQFDVSLDREQNIFCLCSNCHNQIHYGTEADVRQMLKTLFALRSQEISDILDREITLDEIYAMYKV